MIFVSHICYHCLKSTLWVEKKVHNYKDYNLNFLWGQFFCDVSMKKARSVYLEFYYFILFKMLRQKMQIVNQLTWHVIDIASSCQSLCILSVQYLLKLHVSMRTIKGIGRGGTSLHIPVQVMPFYLFTAFTIYRVK